MRVSVHLGAEWCERIRREGLAPEALERPVRAALAELARGLGLAGSVEVQVDASPGGALSVRAGGRLLGYPTDLPSRTLGVEGPGGDACRELPLVVTAIAALHPASLLDDAAVAKYLEALPDGLMLPRLGVAQTLRGLLGRGLSLADAETVGRGLLQGAELGLEPAGVEEWLVTRLRTRFLVLEVEPKYAAELFGQPLSDGEELLPDTLDGAVPEYCASLAEAVFSDLGLRLPRLLVVGRATLPHRGFAIRVNHLPGTPWTGFAPHERLVTSPPHELRIPHVLRVHPLTGADWWVVDEAAAELALAAGGRTYEPLEYLFMAALAEVKRRAGQFLDIEQVEYELALVADSFPDLVRAALERLSMVRLTVVLRLLLDGGVPIRDLRTILERVAGFDVVFADTRGRIVLDDRAVVDERLARAGLDRTDACVRYVRSGLARAISQRCALGGEVLSVFPLDRQRVEELLLQHLAAGDHEVEGENLEVERIVAALRFVVGRAFQDTRPAILADPSVAGFVREILAPEFPLVPVLSYEDVAPEIDLHVLAQIAPDV